MRRDDFTVIYSGNIVQADLLKCLLEGKGIQTFLEDEFLGKMVPYAVAAGGAGAVKVLIANSDLDQARKMLKTSWRTAGRNDINTEVNCGLEQMDKPRHPQVIRTWKAEHIRNVPETHHGEKDYLL